MPCYKPLTAWRSRKLNEKGKRGITFDLSKGLSDHPLSIACGSCTGCRLERSRQWALRCVHEASLYEDNCFVTLTYEDQYLKNDRSLSIRDTQLFLKRLRKEFSSRKVRFFLCGEYGEGTKRPHYHACLFNLAFPDRVLWSVRNGNRLYTSETLNRLWGFGYCVIGDVTFESAAYVARYIMKKVTGVEADDYYKERQAEFVTMSRRPGIARSWYESFKGDLFPSDFLVLKGKKVPIPKYYNRLFESDSPEEYAHIKNARVPDQSSWNERSLLRLRDKEVVNQHRISFLKRGLHDDC